METYIGITFLGMRWKFDAAVQYFELFTWFSQRKQNVLS